jgi:hypothetical protein
MTRRKIHTRRTGGKYRFQIRTGGRFLQPEGLEALRASVRIVATGRVGAASAGGGGGETDRVTSRADGCAGTTEGTRIGDGFAASA